MQRLFTPPARSARSQLEQLEQTLNLKYRDHGTARGFTLHSSPPAVHEPQVLFEPPAPLSPAPQAECLF